MGLADRDRATERSAASGQPSPWTSLEVTKLIASLLLPVVLLFISHQYTVAAERAATERADLEKRQALQRADEEKRQALVREREAKVIEKRVHLWDELGPRINAIYSYYMFVGDWKALHSKDIIRIKRELDTLVYSYRPFFSDKFFAAYSEFTTAAFHAFGGWGKDAQLRTTPDHRYEPPSQVINFTDEDNRSEVHQTYYAVLNAAAIDLGLLISVPTPPSAGPQNQ